MTAYFAPNADWTIQVAPASAHSAGSTAIAMSQPAAAASIGGPVALAKSTHHPTLGDFIMNNMHHPDEDKAPHALAAKGHQALAQLQQLKLRNLKQELALP